MPGYGEGGYGEGGYGSVLVPPSGHRAAQRIKITAWTKTAMSVSPYTGSQQVYQWPGEGWALDVSLPPMKATDAEEWIAFLLQLRGRSGLFEFGDTARTSPRGVATGTPLTFGTGNVTFSPMLATDGWTNSVTGILKAGDYIQIQVSGGVKRLHKVLADANSGATTGPANLYLFPRLREIIPDNTPIVIASPRGTWRLANDDTEWDIDAAKVYGLRFSAIEAL